MEFNLGEFWLRVRFGQANPKRFYANFFRNDVQIVLTVKEAQLLEDGLAKTAAVFWRKYHSARSLKPSRKA